MSDAFESIVRGLKEALAHARGDVEEPRLHTRKWADTARLPTCKCAPSCQKRGGFCSTCGPSKVERSNLEHLEQTGGSAPGLLQVDAAAPATPHSVAPGAPPRHPRRGCARGCSTMEQRPSLWSRFFGFRVEREGGGGVKHSSGMWNRRGAE